MKALTLHQPWASLIALGAKTIETRCWNTKYRGPLAIHAGMKGVQGEFDSFWCERDRSGYLLRGPIAWPYRLPLGAVVATCNLVNVLPIRDSMDPDATGDYIIVGDKVGVGFVGDHDFGMLDQVPYGDFTPGRFAWILGNVKPIKQPIPQRGYQRLWNWEAATLFDDDAAALEEEG